MGELCGHEEEFVSETPSYLCCAVCLLVLRDPQLVVSCGHKFCRPCFDRLKERTTGSDQLVCPLDRKVIDVTKVYFFFVAWGSSSLK